MYCRYTGAHCFTRRKAFPEPPQNVLQLKALFVQLRALAGETQALVLRLKPLVGENGGTLRVLPPQIQEKMWRRKSNKQRVRGRQNEERRLKRSAFLRGNPLGVRTRDPFIKSEVLYLLS